MQVPCIVVFLFVLFSLVCCDTLFVSSEVGKDIENCGTQDTPCATLETALHQITNSTSSVIVTMDPGTYSGNQNINVLFPSVSVRIQNVDTSRDVIFDCAGAHNSVAFHGHFDLQLNNINIVNCSQGIRFEPLRAFQSLSLTRTMIHSCETGIMHRGGNLIVYNTEIRGCYRNGNELYSGSGVFIDQGTNATISYVQIFSSYIQDTSGYSLYAEGSIENLDVTYTDFLKYGSVFIAAGENCLGTFADNNFIGFQSTVSSTAIEIQGGMWSIESSSLSGVILEPCDISMHLVNLNNAEISRIENYIGTYGFRIDGGKLQMEDLAIRGQDVGIYAEYDPRQPISLLRISHAYFETVSKSISVVCSDNRFDTKPLLSIVNCSFPETGQVNIQCAATGRIENSTFVDINNERDIYIDGPGSWSIRNVSMSNTNSGAGAIEMRNPQISATIEACMFENNEATDGAGIFFQGRELNVSQTSFVGNAAQNNGGGVYLHSGTGHFNEVTFSSNSALDGAAIYCTSLSNITLETDTVEFNDNTNVEGSDFPCEVLASNGNNLWIWVVIGLVFILSVIFFVVFAILAFLWYRRKFESSKVTFELDFDDDEADLIEMGELDEEEETNE